MPRNIGFFPDRCRGCDDLPELRRTTLYNIFARLLFPALTRSASKTAFGQTVIDLATVACALERYRIANGEYPENLAVLAPRFLAKVPNDVINGEPLKYRRATSGQFVLYSVGWNERMMAGSPPPGRRDQRQDRTSTEGDWIWQYRLAVTPVKQISESSKPCSFNRSAGIHACAVLANVSHKPERDDAGVLTPGSVFFLRVLHPPFVNELQLRDLLLAGNRKGGAFEKHAGMDARAPTDVPQGGYKAILFKYAMERSACSMVPHSTEKTMSRLAFCQRF